MKIEMYSISLWDCPLNANGLCDVSSFRHWKERLLKYQISIISRNEYC